jgi:hypothetical protein
VGDLNVDPNSTRSYSVSSAVRVESGSLFQGSTGSGMTSLASNSYKMGRVELVKKDWLRFITFVKMCLMQLL